MDHPGDRRGVSPVIGIILMVAIVVILAAAIGTYVTTSFDRETNPAPSVTFEYSYDEGASELTVTMTAGDKFDGVNVEFRRKAGTGSSLNPADWSGEPIVTSAESVTIENVEPDNEILIVWSDPRANDQTQILGSWEGPES